MKFFAVIVLVLAAFSALISAIPSPQDVLPGYSMLVQEPEDEIQTENEAITSSLETGRADRQRRATCDLLSFTSKLGSVNHAACAAHCLAKMRGFRGGRCIDGVCHCRR